MVSTAWRANLSQTEFWSLGIQQAKKWRELPNKSLINSVQLNKNKSLTIYNLLMAPITYWLSPSMYSLGAEKVEANKAAKVGPSISVRYASFVQVGMENEAMASPVSKSSSVTPIPAPLEP